MKAMKSFANENRFSSIYFWLILFVLASSVFVLGRVTAVIASHTIVLRDIDSYKSYTFAGVDPDDRAGYDVDAGDVNGDGIADLIIGSEHADPNGKMDAGTTYVIFGPVTGDLSDLATQADVIVNGQDRFDCVGAGVSTGDVNDDGFNDLIVGDWGADPRNPDGNLRWGAGETYVIFGPLTPSSQLTLQMPDDADVVINGADYVDHSGVGVGSGDLNNDGIADLLIGAEYGDSPSANNDLEDNVGTAYVIYGPVAHEPGIQTVLELSTDTDIAYYGDKAEGWLGGAVAVGDVDNDGVDDLIAGADNYDIEAGREVAARSYVLFGPIIAGSPVSSTVDDIANKLVINGTARLDRLGRNVSSGDVNNDGMDDLIVGAGFADVNGMNDAGAAYVFLGPRNSGTLEVATAADQIYTGANPGDGLGVGASVADINNDGNNDLLLGAWWADPEGRLQAGEVYAVLGLPPVTNVPSLAPLGLLAASLAFGALFVIMRRRRVGLSV